jgi:hypothetical protein
MLTDGEDGMISYIYNTGSETIEGIEAGQKKYVFFNRSFLDIIPPDIITGIDNGILVCYDTEQMVMLDVNNAVYQLYNSMRKPDITMDLANTRDRNRYLRFVGEQLVDIMRELYASQPISTRIDALTKFKNVVSALHVGDVEVALYLLGMVSPDEIFTESFKIHIMNMAEACIEGVI